jgi:hypothetical protein
MFVVEESLPSAVVATKSNESIVVLMNGNADIPSGPFGGTATNANNDFKPQSADPKPKMVNSSVNLK